MWLYRISMSLRAAGVAIYSVHCGFSHGLFALLTLWVALKGVLRSKELVLHYVRNDSVNFKITRPGMPCGKH
ncbi:hypothetical protein [Thiomicrorhabdus sp. Kp2]|uniref:hypothetical protein n=1 Tax=Thiomicrorhabdus sp. Kp2 TaxID=1123518 RepID=UPI0012FEB8F5|nr:hypothetical protein [Thiomicrorhabdus sp. Kp2]